MLWAQKQKGFTIVELLIVIVVIAILAAVTIVAYSGIQNRAKASAAQAAAAQAAKKVAVWQVDNANQSPDQNTFDGLVGAVSSGTSFQYTPGSNGTFCVTATNSNVSYFTSGGDVNPGGCVGHAQNGREVVTNLVNNPSVETNTTFYTVQGGTGGTATGARVTSGGLYGSSFYRETWTVAPTASGSAYIMMAGTGTNDAIVGRTYYFRADSRASWVTTLRLTIVWWNSSNATISSSNGTNVVVTPGQWTTLTASGIAPANTVRVRFLVENVGTLPSVGSTLDADGLFIAEGSGPYGYGDGSSQDWTWSSTANSSTSFGPRL